MSVVCPKCLSESQVAVNVEDGESLYCPECEENYTVTEVRELLDSWKAILPWLEAHPARAEAALAK